MLGPCFVVQYFVSLLVLQSSVFVALDCCVLNVMSLLLFFDSSSRCHGLICSV